MPGNRKNTVWCPSDRTTRFLQEFPERSVATKLVDQHVHNIPGIMLSVAVVASHGQVNQVVMKIQADKCSENLACIPGLLIQYGLFHIHGITLGKTDLIKENQNGIIRCLVPLILQ